MDPFELNTLHRFVKHSPGLSLEQHGSCDVPAGCGGVVFRWLNPAREARLNLLFYSEGEATFFLDGREIHSTVLSVAAGEHELTIQIEGAATFLMVVSRNPEPHQQTLFVSCEDGSWTGTHQPPESDQPWPILHQIPFGPKVGKSWRRTEAEEAGALPLGVPGASNLWVRKVFQL